MQTNIDENSNPIEDAASAALDPEPIVRDRQYECLVPPEAAAPLSVSRFDGAHDQ